jgi:2-phospho-L-lactate transferase/gluconeogenesis factor (CofD/UPF0052 family)
MRIVAIGGGTGLSMLLRGLKNHVAPRQRQNSHQPISDLAAVVTVTDDGGSSGRLRREYSVLPPGDLRNCLVALSEDEALLSRLFQYRFQSGIGLRGHSFGNLFLTALSHVTGDFTHAVRVTSEVLAIRGRIFPATNQFVSLEARLENGKLIAGETHIGRTRVPIRRVRLVPRKVKPLPEVLEAIATADGVTEAIEESKAKRVYIANLMTQPGETLGYTLVDHVRAIHQHTGRKIIDYVVINDHPLAPDVLRRYKSEGAEPVAVDFAELQRMGLQCIFDNLLEVHGVVRHNSDRLASLLLREFVEK